MSNRARENDMTIKDRIGQVWTGLVAYVALVIGAGLSITFNVVDVMEVRGAALDRWDILTAVAFPALVVLMVEMFVSRLWTGQPWPMQALRWGGTLSIGGIAMRVSWTHGHDFFINRGQAHDVANLGPLSIDLLAIMATALILSGRSASWSARAAARQAALDIPAPVATAEPMDSWLDRMEALAAEMDAPTSPAAPVDIQPISPPPALARSNEVKLESVPEDVALLIKEWGQADSEARPTAKDMAEILAGEFGRSSRTIRRWRAALGVN
jgi:hypothetical protein